MGENLKTTSMSAYWIEGPEKYVPIEGLTVISLFEEEKNHDQHIELYKEPIEFNIDIKPLYNKLSRKRFKKWLMSIGYSRNLAELYSKRICQKHIPYKSMQLPFLIDSFGTVMFLMEE